VYTGDRMTTNDDTRDVSVVTWNGEAWISVMELCAYLDDAADAAREVDADIPAEYRLGLIAAFEGVANMMRTARII
jgi:hypothetical protein